MSHEVLGGLTLFDKEALKEFLVSGENVEHSVYITYSKEIKLQPALRKLYEKCSGTGNATSLPGIIARARLASLKELHRPFQAILAEAKRHGERLRNLLDEDTLFDLQSEQDLLGVLLLRLDCIRDSKPNPLTLKQQGKKSHHRRLRQNMAVELQLEGIDVEPVEFSTLCSIADPEIEAATARREYRRPYSNEQVMEIRKRNHHFLALLKIYLDTVGPDYEEEVSRSLTITRKSP